MVESKARCGTAEQMPKKRHLEKLLSEILPPLNSLKTPLTLNKVASPTIRNSVFSSELGTFLLAVTTQPLLPHCVSLPLLH
ncbi:hypothetical protein E4U13_001649 [Claviceps humidiphila]|uniref:Uncharacterized protein n=1 Tax=Claviceps humidiphila TaxID=1294629 RepID=A0A9P7TV18_9HYPO|nr:hypothetical protein E4U13_001649 [Claviceps humidiphila]